MIKMGFVETFVKLILRCISSVSYSIRVNNSIYGTITPLQGIHQGDPLSSFLFVSCSQRLSAFLLKAEAENRFKGVQIANSCPPISHLFFADESLIFFRASEQECFQLKRCIQTYERAAGQLVNYDKSALSSHFQS